MDYEIIDYFKVFIFITKKGAKKDFIIFSL